MWFLHSCRIDTLVNINIHNLDPFSLTYHMLDIRILDSNTKHHNAFQKLDLQGVWLWLTIPEVLSTEFFPFLILPNHELLFIILASLFISGFIVWYLTSNLVGGIPLTGFS
jgi:hypothetical protein